MNPLLSREFRIPFDEIRAEQIEPGIRGALAEAEARLEALVSHEGARSYQNTVEALDDLKERLGRVVGIAYHLTSVNDTPALRQSFNAVLPEFSTFFAKLPLHDGLWLELKRYAQSDEAKGLRGVYRRHLDKTVREFVRAGADLPPEKKARAQEIRVELSKRQTTFSENVLDSTNAFELVLTDESELAGLPPSVRRQARASAAEKGLEGYRFTLQAPSYMPFMQHAERRERREQLYQARANRACVEPLDNRPLVRKILALRQELAELLGYKDYADYVLEERMVKSGEAAWRFAEDLTARTRPYWDEELAELEAFAESELGIDTLEPWDLAFVMERLRKARFDLDDEELRPYFPLEQVLEGLFAITQRLFGITVSPSENPKVWHQDVRYYDIHDEAGSYLGSFYADWYPRETKREGAWMNELITGGPRKHGFEPHLGLMAANFTPPQEGKPALLTHREVETIFHEFGHLLHHCLSRVEVPARSGVHVAWDFVELPSQIMENWCWEREALDLFARHHETGERIPEDLFRRLQASRTFMGGYQQMRQLSFATVDLALHRRYQPERDGDVVVYAQRVMEPFQARPEFAHNHFITSFSHVFAGGYAAGYYSYKWAEVLDADAFTRFKREGIFNPETGRAFLENVLARGDSDDPEVLYRAFMGREPELEALLARNLAGAAVAAD